MEAVLFLVPDEFVLDLIVLLMYMFELLFTYRYLKYAYPYCTYGIHHCP